MTMLIAPGRLVVTAPPPDADEIVFNPGRMVVRGQSHAVLASTGMVGPPSLEIIKGDDVAVKEHVVVKVVGQPWWRRAWRFTRRLALGLLGLVFTIAAFETVIQFFERLPERWGWFLSLVNKATTYFESIRELAKRFLGT